MKTKRIIITLIALLLVSAGIRINSLLPVITGYAAKNLASGVFVAGRSQESLEKEDLAFSVIRYTSNKVDFEQKEVISRFLWGKSKAIYIEGYGCTLVNGFSDEEIRQRPYASVAAAPGRPDTIRWPAGDLLTDTIPAGIDLQRLKPVVNRIMTDTLPFKGTFALMVLYKGYPVAEEYRGDFNRDTRFLSWSMAKSVTSALIGLRVKEGKLDIYSPCGLPEWQQDERSKITLNHLLHMNSGLEWNEDYGNLSDVTIMLHKEGDMAGYTASKMPEAPAGEHWEYSSGTTNLVSSLLRRSFNSDHEYFAYPRQALFNPLGMKSAVFEADASGTFVGSSYLYATMRDYARFALLYINQGNWMGEQILPNEWVNYTVSPAEGSDGKYGAFFWLNLSGDQPDAPRDMYMCKGHDGQYIFIIPSRQLIVIRTGYSKQDEFDTNRMLKEILDCLE